MSKIYKQKINYHNSDGDFPKGTLWKLSKNKAMYLYSYTTGKVTDVVTLHTDFVENNPDIFEDCTKEWLLLEARKRYPIGTKYTSISFDTLNAKSKIRGELRFVPLPQNRSFNNNGLKITDGWGGAVYYDGKWAKIIKEPLFTTEDGIDIYEGDLYYLVWIDSKGHASHLNSTTPNQAIFNRKSSSNICKKFFTIEKAQEYIDLNQPKYSKQDIIDAYWNSYSADSRKPIFQKRREVRIDKVINELDKDE